MREKLQRFSSSYWLLTVALLMAAVSMLPSVPLNCQSARAFSASSPSDYCYQTDISVTYSGGGTLTNQPVRLELPAASMVSASSQLDPRGWDIYTIQGSFANGQHMLLQETGDATSGNWIIVPSIDNTETEDFRMYSGQNNRRRDQSIWFTGGDEVVVSDHADFDITDNLDIEITISNRSDTARDEGIVDKVTGGAGYGVDFVDVASALTLRFIVDATTCDLTWSSAWTDAKQDFRFEYISAAGIDATIYRNGAAEVTCDLDAGAIGTNADNLYIGSHISSADPLTDVEIHSVSVNESGVRAGYWEFRADHMEETSETNPYTGTIDDLTANAHNATYTFNRLQTGLTAGVGPTVPINLSSTSSIVVTTLDLLDGAAPDIVFGSGTEQTGSLFHDLFLDPLADIGPSRKISMALILTALGFGIGIAVFMATDKRFMPVATMIAAFPVWIGAYNGWVDWWYGATWAMIVLFTWFAFRRDTESA